MGNEVHRVGALGRVRAPAALPALLALSRPPAHRGSGPGAPPNPHLVPVAVRGASQFPILTAFYFGLGYGINYQMGKRGREAVPNVEFWAEFPGLVRDGCAFTYHTFVEARTKVRETHHHAPTP